MQEDRDKVQISIKTQAEFFKNGEINKFEMYKTGLKIRERGFPNWFNPFRDLIENPEYYFGFKPEV